MVKYGTYIFFAYLDAPNDSLDLNKKKPLSATIDNILLSMVLRYM